MCLGQAWYEVMLKDKHYSKFGGLITCRNTSYYSLLERIMRPKCIINVSKRVAYVVNS